MEAAQAEMPAFCALEAALAEPRTPEFCALGAALAETPAVCALEAALAEPLDLSGQKWKSLFLIWKS